MLRVGSQCPHMPAGKDTRTNAAQFSLFSLQEKLFAIIFTLTTGLLSSENFYSDFRRLFRM